MRTLSLGLTLLILFSQTAEAGVFNYIFRYRGYKFDEKTKTCKKKRGKVGFNKKFYGPCGDLTGFSSKRLVKKINRSLVHKNSLRGAKLIGLNFAGADMKKVRFEYSDLRGANLEGLKNQSLFAAHGAVYDSTTKIPFSDYTAITTKGMVKRDLQKITDAYNNYGLILEETDMEKLTRNLKSVSSLTKEYHEEMRNIFRDSFRGKAVNVKIVKAMIDSFYYSNVELEELKKQADMAVGSERTRLKDIVKSVEALRTLMNESIENGIYRVGNTVNMDPLLDILDSGFTGESYVTAPLKKAVRYIADELKPIFGQEAHLRFVKLLLKYSFRDLAIDWGSDYFEKYGEKNLQKLAILANEFPSNWSNRWRYAFVKVTFPTLGEVATDQMMLFRTNTGISDEFVVDFIDMVSDLTFDNAVKLADSVRGGKKDTVFIFALKKIADLKMAQVYVLRTEAYNQLNVIKQTLRFLSDNSLLKAREYASKYKGTVSDLILAHYYNTIAKTMELADYDKLRGLIYNLDEFVFLTVKNITELAFLDVIEFSERLGDKGRKALVKRYLELVETITTDELLTLFDKTVFSQNDLIAHLGKISDLTYKNVVKIAGHLNNNNSDKVLTFFIEKEVKVNGVTVRDLMLLRDVSYSLKEQIILDNLQYIKDWNIINALILMGKATYSNKNTVGNYYLSQVVEDESITLKDLMRVYSAGYDYPYSLVTDNLAKLKNFKFNVLTELASKFGRSVKDKIIEFYLKKHASFTAEEFYNVIRISYDKSYQFATTYFAKISDKNVAGVLKLSQHFSRSYRDEIIKLYLELNPSLTGEEMITLARGSYNLLNDILVNRMSLTSDLTVATASKMVRQLSRYNKDEFLRKAISRVTDLTTDNLYDFASLAYTAKDEIIQLGLDRL